MVTVTYEDLSSAFDFVNFGGSDEHRAYIDTDTGAIYWVSDLTPTDGEVPEDLEESNRYLAVPQQNDLELGRDLVFRFAAERLPARYETVKDIFRRRGAYARFKALLSAERLLDDWYAFEADATKTALKAWCADRGVQLVEDGTSPSA